MGRSDVDQCTLAWDSLSSHRAVLQGVRGIFPAGSPCPVPAMSPSSAECFVAAPTAPVGSCVVLAVRIGLLTHGSRGKLTLAPV
jgi:hypothetical protein